jgi:hypothetical protein
MPDVTTPPLGFLQKPLEGSVDALLGLFGLDNPGAQQTNANGIAQMLAAALPMVAATVAKVAPEAIQGIKAYHGSPHDFDQFSLSKIGTGEGAQAYGHGLYLAEHPDVARGYRDMVPATERASGGALDTNMRLGGKRVEDVYRQIDTAAARMPVKAAQGMYDRLSALEALMQHGDMKAVQEAVDAGQVTPEAAQWLMSQSFTRRGKLYEVNLKADPSHFLDWDKPLSQQSDHVRGALGYSGGMPSQAEIDGVMALAKARGVPVDTLPEYKALEARMDSRVGAPGNPDVTGAAYYRNDPRAVRPTGEGDAAMSAHLKERGIPGIKYLDQGSRDTGNGTSNYVVFDDALISILRKYGLLPPLAAGMASMANHLPAPQAKQQ